MDTKHTILVFQGEIDSSPVSTWQEIKALGYRFNPTPHHLGSDPHNLSLSGKGLGDYYLEERSSALSKVLGVSTPEFTSLSHMIDSALLKPADRTVAISEQNSPSLAYEQGMFSLLLHNVAAGLTSLEGPTHSVHPGVKVRGKTTGDFVNENGQILFQSSLACQSLEFKDEDGKKTNIPLRVQVEYTAKFVQATNVNELSYFKIKFPIIIKGPDAEIFRELFVQGKVSQPNLDIILGRKKLGLGISDPFEVLLNQEQSWPILKELAEKIVTEGSQESTALVLDGDVSPIKETKSIRQRKLILALYKDLSNAVAEYQLSEFADPAKLREMFWTIQNQSSIRGNKFAYEICKKFIALADKLSPIESLLNLIRSTDFKAQATEVKRNAIIDMMVRHIKSTTDSQQLKSIMNAFNAQVVNPNRVLHAKPSSPIRYGATGYSTIARAAQLQLKAFQAHINPPKQFPKSWVAELISSFSHWIKSFWKPKVVQITPPSMPVQVNADIGTSVARQDLVLPEGSTAAPQAISPDVTKSLRNSFAGEDPNLQAIAVAESPLNTRGIPIPGQNEHAPHQPFVNTPPKSGNSLVFFKGSSRLNKSNATPVRHPIPKDDDFPFKIDL
ncbi:MAG: hypothetical protein Q7V63_04610 [Gammaproteobacteria bacterium]|nr:hypothetical protein [Gammaproteobacteria bacterium]